MTNPATTVAVLGTGTMGAPMARNLAAAGFQVRVWNRNPERAAPLAEVGATVAVSATEAVAGASVIVTMLFDADSVAEVMASVGPLDPAMLWIQMSTVGVAGERRLAAIANDLGIKYADAPVAGTKQPAEQGTLVILASGPAEVRDQCQPIFDAVGARTVWAGAAGAGSKLKLVVNSWVLTVLQGIAETLTFAQALGLEPELFLQAVDGSATYAPYVGAKGKAMLARDFTPSFSVAGALKDADLILAAADSAGKAMAAVQAARGSLQRAADLGHGGQDMAAVYLAL